MTRSIHPHVLLLLIISNVCLAQQTDSLSRTKQYKNVVRYNLSGALFFGSEKYIVLGYERLVRSRQTFSINFGRASLPKVVSVDLDSVDISRSRKRSGFNVSVDYRFYLARENKYKPPHGLYIGPYYSFNQFTSGTEWRYDKDQGNSYVNTDSKLNIHTVGFELGYQFILWKRVALDFVLVGPGLGFYNYDVTFDSNIAAETKAQITDGLEQLITQKFPGMNYVFSDSQINAEGVMKTNNLGYRYIIHIGFLF